MNKIKFDIPNRLERGRELFLLELAGIIREEVQRKAPAVEIGDEKVDYAKELRIGLLSGVDDEEAVAIYFEGAAVVIPPGQVAKTVLFIRNMPGSPLWVGVLGRYSPWPADMLPVPMKPNEGKIISRKARIDEIRELSRRLYARRQEIENDLANAGAKNAKVEKTGFGTGIVVNEDIGYNVLRKEFGYDGGPQASHWRPALKAVKERIPEVAQKFIMYLTTGKESIFDLPNDIEDVSTSKFTEGEGFQKVLAPFAPKG
jgi:hypothetical protein